MKRLCSWCNKVEVEPPYWSCEECIKNREVHNTYKDTPDKGSDRWYKEKWYMKNEKTLREDIRSRHTTDRGKTVIRVDNKGNRIY